MGPTEFGTTPGRILRRVYAPSMFGSLMGEFTDYLSSLRKEHGSLT